MGRGLPIGVPAEVSTHRCVPPASDLKAPPNSKASQTRMSSPPNAGHRPPSACVSLGIRSGVSSHEEFAAWPSPESLPRTCPPPLTPSLFCPSPCFCTRKARLKFFFPKVVSLVRKSQDGFKRGCHSRGTDAVMFNFGESEKSLVSSSTVPRSTVQV